MAKVNYSTPQLTPPAWAGEYFDCDSLIPGGGRIDPSGFSADAKGRKPIKSGTLVGRTFAERNAGTGFGLAVASDDEIYLLAFDVTDAIFEADCELYRHGGLVKENFLPGWNDLSAELKAAIRSRYQCIIGVA